MNIKLVKLVSGDSIIADVSIKDGLVILKDPHTVIPTQEGAGLISYNKINGCVEGDIVIKKSHILFYKNPIEPLLNAYQEQTGHIVTPGGIVT